MFEKPVMSGSPRRSLETPKARRRLSVYLSTTRQPVWTFSHLPEPVVILVGAPGISFSTA